MSSTSIMRSKFNYFGNIEKLVGILNKIKCKNENTFMISENNILLELIFKYNTIDENNEHYDNIFTKEQHIDFIIEEIKKINIKGTISLRKTYGNTYIY
jgi:hypothetical protein